MKEGKYQTFKKLHMIFDAGDIVNRNFYVILKGEIKVLVPLKTVKKPVKLQKSPPSPSKSPKMKFWQQNFSHTHESSEVEISLKYPGYKIVNTQSFGSGFGEIALTENIPRTAAIVCSKETHLFVLSEKDFSLIL